MGVRPHGKLLATKTLRKRVLAGAGAGASVRVRRTRRAFLEAAPVFAHPRCTNCHTLADAPRQGDAQRVHQLGIKRGPEGRGETATQRCAACHKAENTSGGVIPGAADWRMPPPGRAGWDGLTPRETCEAIKDPARNAGLTLLQVVEHMDRDPLVLWAWSPARSVARSYCRGG